MRDQQQYESLLLSNHGARSCSWLAAAAPLRSPDRSQTCTTYVNCTTSCTTLRLALHGTNQFWQAVHEQREQLRHNLTFLYRQTTAGPMMLPFSTRLAAIQISSPDHLRSLLTGQQHPAIKPDRAPAPQLFYRCSTGS